MNLHNEIKDLQRRALRILFEETREPDFDEIIRAVEDPDSFLQECAGITD